MKNFLFSTLLLMLPFSMMAQQEYRVLSPDGLTYLNVKLADGRLTYNAGYRTVVKAKKKGAVADTLDVPMILESPLGLYTSVGDFSKGLEYRPMPKNVERLNQKHEYTLRQGKQSKISSEENTLLLCFTNPEAKAKKLVMWVLFNVFNNNIAYCYRICQEQGSQTSAVVVTGEASGFRLPTDATAFICPQSDPMIGWM